ncbi:MAG: hypothetical protein ACOVOT_02760 [Rubrivivax sp.]
MNAEDRIGGYDRIDVPGEPGATDWAAKWPAAQCGAIGVRPLAFSPM